MSRRWDVVLAAVIGASMPVLDWIGSVQNQQLWERQQQYKKERDKYWDEETPRRQEELRRMQDEWEAQLPEKDAGTITGLLHELATKNTIADPYYRRLTGEEIYRRCAKKVDEYIAGRLNEAKLFALFAIEQTYSVRGKEFRDLRMADLDRVERHISEVMLLSSAARIDPPQEVTRMRQLLGEDYARMSLEERARVLQQNAHVRKTWPRESMQLLPSHNAYRMGRREVARLRGWELEHEYGVRGELVESRETRYDDEGNVSDRETTTVTYHDNGVIKEVVTMRYEKVHFVVTDNRSGSVSYRATRDVHYEWRVRNKGVFDEEGRLLRERSGNQMQCHTYNEDSTVARTIFLSMDEGALSNAYIALYGADGSITYYQGFPRSLR